MASLGSKSGHQLCGKARLLPNQKGSPSACHMAVANKLFQEVAGSYTKAVVLSDSIYTQNSLLKCQRWNSNAEMDRLHSLYRKEHHAPAMGEKQKLALFLLCPGFTKRFNACAVGKACEVHAYVSWKEGDEHAKQCASRVGTSQPAVGVPKLLCLRCGSTRRADMECEGGSLGRCPGVPRAWPCSTFFCSKLFVYCSRGSRVPFLMITRLARDLICHTHN